eukprot:355871-Chlamydomonas_euryale.AAC.9
MIVIWRQKIRKLLCNRNNRQEPVVHGPALWCLCNDDDLDARILKVKAVQWKYMWNSAAAEQCDCNAGLASVSVCGAQQHMSSGHFE